MSDSTDSELIFWSILNHEAAAVRERIVRRWRRILTDRNHNEETYHRFLHDNAGWFFSDGVNRLVVLSKIRLGANCVTDFVTTYSQMSHGFFYELIEIESPHAPPFTNAGDPSARLAHAIRQIHDWKDWLEENREGAKRLFPSALFSIHDCANFRFTIYIGNRENTSRWLPQRNRLSSELGIEIRSFDALTDHLKRRPLLDFSILSEEIGYPISTKMMNELANPFAKAHSDKVWRQITADPNFRLHHMITTNVPLLLKNREYSNEYARFLLYWHKLPKTVRDNYVESSRGLQRLLRR